MAFKYLELCLQRIQLMDLESYSTHLKLVFYRLGNWDSSALISSSVFFSLCHVTFPSKMPQLSNMVISFQCDFEAFGMTSRGDGERERNPK